MSEERVERWAVVNGTKVDASFTSRQYAVDWIGSVDRYRLVHLVEKRDTESIVDTAELSALREKAKGPSVEAPRPFKVGDRVKSIKSGDVAEVIGVDSRGFVRCSWDGLDGTIDWNPDRFELLAPAPAPEATAALGGAITQKMVPESWLNDALKVSEEWIAKHADAKARLDDLRQTIDELMVENKELQARAEKAERERDDMAQTISRVWAALGNPSYESLGGKSISGVVADLRARAESLKVENYHMRECLAKFTDGGMSGAEVRAAKDDERARFERETARMFRAAQLATQSGQWCSIQEAKKFTEAVWS